MVVHLAISNENWKSEYENIEETVTKELTYRIKKAVSPASCTMIEIGYKEREEIQKESNSKFSEMYLKRSERAPAVRLPRSV